MTQADLANPLSDQTILIVDDNAANISILAAYLEAKGFTVLVARDGESGLQKAAYALPDLILMDVMMPGLDGYQTCTRLKADDATRDIPIIFMTALSDINSKIKGFSVGAVDFVTKPLQQEEVLARVSTHLKMRLLTRRLQASNAALAQTNADKDKFLSILAHDLRGPFLPLLGSAELLVSRIESLSPAQIKDMSLGIYDSARRVLALLENLLEWGRLQMGHVELRPRRLELAQVVQLTLDLLAPTASAKNVALAGDVPPGIRVHADRHMLDFILRNLLTNAVKFTPSGGAVHVSAQVTSDDTAAVSVVDTGVGISPHILANLFQIGIHQTTPGTNNESGSGLGLILCREMVQRSGGDIAVHSVEDEGTTVTFTLPLAPDEEMGHG
ncbi:MAG: hybrid sensor histidine kinase/response regulator [Anaerolineales bacterium]|nr:hybrid sensor histidine kinase/response regulator [Anaerolineales bacterium]